jgi:hypothetical protein
MVFCGSYIIANLSLAPFAFGQTVEDDQFHAIDPGRIITIHAVEGTYRIPVNYLINRPSPVDSKSPISRDVSIAFLMPSLDALDEDWFHLQLKLSNTDPRSRGLFGPNTYLVTFSILGDLAHIYPLLSDDRDPLAILGNVIGPTDKADFSRRYGLLEVKLPFRQTYYFANIYNMAIKASVRANLRCLDFTLVSPPPPPVNCEGVVQDEALGLRYRISLPRAKVTEFLEITAKVRFLVSKWFFPADGKKG